MIEVRDLTKIYPARGSAPEVKALDHVSLTIDSGDIFGIIGLSGAGKSTLIRCINLLERPTAGAVLVNGVDITQFDSRQLQGFPQSLRRRFPGLQPVHATDRRP